MKSVFEKELEGERMCLTHKYRWKYCNVNPSKCKFVISKEHVLSAKNKIKKEILDEIEKEKDKAWYDYCNDNDNQVKGVKKGLSKAKKIIERIL